MSGASVDKLVKTLKKFILHNVGPLIAWWDLPLLEQWSKQFPRINPLKVVSWYGNLCSHCLSQKVRISQFSRCEMFGGGRLCACTSLHPGCLSTIYSSTLKVRRHDLELAILLVWQSNKPATPLINFSPPVWPNKQHPWCSIYPLNSATDHTGSFSFCNSGFVFGENKHTHQQWPAPTSTASV